MTTTHRPDALRGAGPDTTTPGERRALGETVRRQVPREALGQWEPPTDRPDPVEILVEQGRHRVPELLPVRYGRMAVSPFTFLRGAPAIMAHDLSTEPDHTAAHPAVRRRAPVELRLVRAPRSARLIFDLNDFDETLPGPLRVGREAALRQPARRGARARARARRPAAGARSRCAHAPTASTCTSLAEADVLDVWYEHIELTEAMQSFARHRVAQEARPSSCEKTRHRTSAQVLTKLTEIIEGERRIRHQPPVLVPARLTGVARHRPGRAATATPRAWTTTTSSCCARFRLVEIAMKVVGVGSVGTRCLIALMHGRDEDDVLFLQVKEAGALGARALRRGAARTTTRASGSSSASGSCRRRATCSSAGPSGRSATTTTSASCAT